MKTPTFDSVAKAFVSFLFNGGEGRSTEQREAFLDTLKILGIITTEQSGQLRYMVRSSTLMGELMDHAIVPSEDRINQFMKED